MTKVEGLSVAFYQVFLQGAWIDCPLSAYTVYSENGEKTRKLCDHSQSEAIIAAKDAEIDELKKDRCFKQHVIDGLAGDKLSLQADNAALTARVKELTTLLDQQMGTPCEQIAHGQQVKTLETQLAAARRALTEIYSKPSHKAHAIALIALEDKL